MMDQLRGCPQRSNKYVIKLTDDYINQSQLSEDKHRTWMPRKLSVQVHKHSPNSHCLFSLRTIRAQRPLTIKVLSPLDHLEMPANPTFQPQYRLRPRVAPMMSPLTLNCLTSHILSQRAAPEMHMPEVQGAYHYKQLRYSERMKILQNTQFRQ